MSNIYTLPTEENRQEYQAKTQEELTAWLIICDDMIQECKDAHRPFNNTKPARLHWQAHRDMIQECITNKENPTP